MYHDNFISVSNGTSFPEAICTNETDEVFTARRILLAFMNFFIVVINAVVVVSSGLILRKGQEPRSTYLFLGNIAMADMVFGLAAFSRQFYFETVGNHHICLIFGVFIVSAGMVSVYSIVLIAVDRYMYIIHGLKYHSWITSKRARILIAAVWIICLTITCSSLPELVRDDTSRCCYFFRVTHRTFGLFIGIVMMTPTLFILTIYSLILCTALKEIKLIRANDRTDSSSNFTDIGSNMLRMSRGCSVTSNTFTDDDRQSNGLFRIFRSGKSINRSPRKWKSIKVVLFTTGSYGISWIPFMLTNLIYIYNCESVSQYCLTLFWYTKHVTFILAFLHSLLNPIIYAWWHQGFRNFISDLVISHKNTPFPRPFPITISAVHLNTNQSFKANGNFKSSTGNHVVTHF